MIAAELGNSLLLLLRNTIKVGHNGNFFLFDGSWWWCDGGTIYLTLFFSFSIYYDFHCKIKENDKNNIWYSILCGANAHFVYTNHTLCKDINKLDFYPLMTKSNSLSSSILNEIHFGRNLTAKTTWRMYV